MFFNGKSKTCQLFPRNLIAPPPQLFWAKPRKRPNSITNLFKQYKCICTNFCKILAFELANTFFQVYMLLTQCLQNLSHNQLCGEKTRFRRQRQGYGKTFASLTRPMAQRPLLQPKLIMR